MLAEIGGFDRQTINRIENGRHSDSLDRVFVLAMRWGVELSWRDGRCC
jgi:DNA-binding XRE family transcriptional regulator